MTTPPDTAPKAAPLLGAGERELGFAAGHDVEFIRLFFRAPDEEEIAFRWASRLGKLVGSRIVELRPETTLSEMLGWGAASKVESIDFVVVFEPELRIEFAAFLDDSDHTTFREMVQHYARRFRP